MNDNGLFSERSITQYTTIYLLNDILLLSYFITLHILPRLLIERKHKRLHSDPQATQFLQLIVENITLYVKGTALVKFIIPMCEVYEKFSCISLQLIEN